jgi:Family of unknown function (DUF5989)
MNLALSSHEAPSSSHRVRSRTRQGRLIVSPGGQQGPDDSSMLRRQRHHCFIKFAPVAKRGDPAAGGIGPTGGLAHHRVSSMNQQGAQIILILVLLGSLIVLMQGSAVAPFIYMLF